MVGTPVPPLGEGDLGYNSPRETSDTFLPQTSLSHPHWPANCGLVICFELFAWSLWIQRLWEHERFCFNTVHIAKGMERGEREGLSHRRRGLIGKEGPWGGGRGVHSSSLVLMKRKRAWGIWPTFSWWIRRRKSLLRVRARPWLKGSGKVKRSGLIAERNGNGLAGQEHKN